MAIFKYQTHVKSILGDMCTPVGVYMQLRDLYPQSVLMESSDYHDKDNSRSFIGIHPIASYAVAHGEVTMTFPDGSSSRQRLHTEAAALGTEQSGAAVVAQSLSDFLSHFEVSGEGSNYCGLYGYTTFNAVRYIENIAVKDEQQDENDAPDMLYVLYENMIVFDHFNNQLTIVSLGNSTEKIEKALHRQTARQYPFRSVGETTSTLTDEEFRVIVRRCVKHCLRGDVFQIVPSRRFVQHYEGDDFMLYRTLRSINPSPYLFYFDFGGFRIFGSSPETHCRIEGQQAYIDPIAGTTKRTGDSEQDRKNAEFLRNDPKENAEHVMLVDLARNDLSRNCHDVHVEFFKDMQFYSHVIHLVSRVTGTLTPHSTSLTSHPSPLTSKIKAFLDTFPAGTLSGAPKVRAMQIISELEPHNRGAYGGCIGYIGLQGDCNQAITIRTFVSRNNELWLQAGCGVVAKSNDEYELQEVNNKLGALVKAIHIAENL